MRDDPGPPAWFTPFTDFVDSPAVETHMLPVAQKLIQARAQVNIRDIDGTTPLMLAAIYQSTRYARLLLAHGADLQARDHTGSTALFWAAERGHPQMVIFLLQKGLDPNTTQRLDGLTPLMEMAAYGDAVSVKALIARGANVRAKTKAGQTALDFAHFWNHPEIVKLLQQASAKT